jgi:hypothetical protein
MQLLEPDKGDTEMERILGTLTGALRHDMPDPTTMDVQRINALSNPPPVPVQPDDIYVRRCRLASDAVDCQFGRFRTEDLPRLLAMTQGVSTLIGHKKDEVGVARFFGGTVEELESVWNPFTRERETIRYIVPKFYWMREHSQAEDLRVNIDGGIYHQVSISWWYEQATCGICGRDMRLCEHVPGKEYEGQLAFYYYDKLGEVLEGSIVFAGGQPFTGFHLDASMARGIEEAKKLYVPKPTHHNSAMTEAIEETEMAADLPVMGSCKNEQVCHEYFAPAPGPELQGRFVAQPVYSGLPIRVEKCDGTVAITDHWGVTIDADLQEIRDAVGALGADNVMLDAVLCVMRGRTRLSRSAVRAYCNNMLPEGARPVLKVVDLWRWNEWDGHALDFGDRWRELERAFEDTSVIQRVRGALAFTPEALAQAAEKWRSRDGLMVRDLDARQRSYQFSTQRELDARVIARAGAGEQVVYQLGIGMPGNEVSLGSVDANGFAPAVGDIVRVQVAEHGLDLPEPVKIVDLRPDKTETDPALLLRHLQGAVTPSRYAMLVQRAGGSALRILDDDAPREFAFAGSMPGPDSLDLWHLAAQQEFGGPAELHEGEVDWSETIGNLRRDGDAMVWPLYPGGNSAALELQVRRAQTDEGDRWLVAVCSARNQLEASAYE